MIKLHYNVNTLSVSPDELLQEIEYGMTFALYPDFEEVIKPSVGRLQWVNGKLNGNIFSVQVNDSFFSNDNFFEKILVSFVYNLLDFGDLRLNSIDLSKSSIFPKVFTRRLEQNEAPNNQVKLGTIFKPYYHLSLQQKVNLSKKYLDLGVNYIKEDETFFASEKEILMSAESIQSVLGQNGFYIPNITHHVHNCRLIEGLLKRDIKIGMIDFLTTGFRGVYELKKTFPELYIWGHRVGYSVLEKYISMQAIVTLSTLAGITFLHIGTPSKENGVQNKRELMTLQKTFNQDATPVFTKTTPQILQNLISNLGFAPVFMACGYFRNTTSGNIDWGKVKEWGQVAYAAQN